MRRERRDVSSSTTSAILTTSFVLSSVGVSFPSLARNVFSSWHFSSLQMDFSVSCEKSWKQVYTNDRLRMLLKQDFLDERVGEVGDGWGGGVGAGRGA